MPEFLLFVASDGEIATRLPACYVQRLSVKWEQGWKYRRNKQNDPEDCISNETVAILTDQTDYRTGSWHCRVRIDMGADKAVQVQHGRNALVTSQTLYQFSCYCCCEGQGSMNACLFV